MNADVAKALEEARGLLRKAVEPAAVGPTDQQTVGERIRNVAIAVGYVCDAIRAGEQGGRRLGHLIRESKARVDKEFGAMLVEVARRAKAGDPHPWNAMEEMFAEDVGRDPRREPPDDDEEEEDDDFEVDAKP